MKMRNVFMPPKEEKKMDKALKSWLEVKQSYDSSKALMQLKLYKIEAEFDKANLKLAKEIANKEKQLLETFKEFEIAERRINGNIIKINKVMGKAKFKELFYKALDELSDSLKNKFIKMEQQQKEDKSIERLAYKTEGIFDVVKDIIIKVTDWIRNIKISLTGCIDEMKIFNQRMDRDVFKNVEEISPIKEALRESLLGDKYANSLH